jgi:hypothetical protein
MIENVLPTVHTQHVVDLFEQSELLNCREVSVKPNEQVKTNNGQPNPET